MLLFSIYFIAHNLCYSNYILINCTENNFANWTPEEILKLVKNLWAGTNCKKILVIIMILCALHNKLHVQV